MTTPKRNYIQAFAVLHVEAGAPPIDTDTVTFERDGRVIPAAGPSHVTVKEVVTTAEEAQNEVIRLNKLNADKGCTYFWQSTHVFVDGGSHGSAQG